MQYVVKRNGKLVGAYGRLVEHFNEAELYPNRTMARNNKEKGDRIYRVKVKPLQFEKVS